MSGQGSHYFVAPGEGLRPQAGCTQVRHSGGLRAGTAVEIQGLAHGRQPVNTVTGPGPKQPRASGPQASGHKLHKGEGGEGHGRPRDASTKRGGRHAASARPLRGAPPAPPGPERGRPATHLSRSPPPRGCHSLRRCRGSPRASSPRSDSGRRAAS